MLQKIKSPLKPEIEILQQKFEAAEDLKNSETKKVYTKTFHTKIKSYIVKQT